MEERKVYYPRLGLRFPFTVTDMGEESVAVAVEEGAEQFHGVIRLQSESARFLFGLLQEGKYNLPDLIFLSMKKYPDSTVEEAGPKVLAFLDTLRDEGVLVAHLPEGFVPETES